MSIKQVDEKQTAEMPKEFKTTGIRLFKLLTEQQVTIKNLFAVLLKPVLFLFLAWGGVSLFSLLQEYTMASVSETLTLRLRKALTDKLNRLPMKFFDQRRL